MFISNKRILIISGICFFAALAVIIFLIYPVFKKFNEYVNEFSGTKKELSLFEKRSNNLLEIKKTYIDWQPSLEKTEKLFIDSEVPIDFIRFLENTSADCGLTLDMSSASSSSESSSGTWPSISYQLSLSGSYNNVMTFLEKVESSPYLIEEQGLNIRRTASQEKNSDISAVSRIKAYTK